MSILLILPTRIHSKWLNLISLNLTNPNKNPTFPHKQHNLSFLYLKNNRHSSTTLKLPSTSSSHQKSQNPKLMTSVSRQLTQQSNQQLFLTLYHWPSTRNHHKNQSVCTQSQTITTLSMLSVIKSLRTCKISRFK